MSSPKKSSSRKSSLKMSSPKKSSSRKSSLKMSSPKKSSSRKSSNPFNSIKSDSNPFRSSKKSSSNKKNKKTKKTKLNCTKIEGKNQCKRNDGPMHSQCYENSNNRCTFKKPEKSCKRVSESSCKQHDGPMDKDCKVSENNRCILNRELVPKINKKRNAQKEEKNNENKKKLDDFDSKWTKGKQLGKEGKEGTGYEVLDSKGNKYAVKEFNNPKKSVSRFLKEVELQKKAEGLAPKIHDYFDVKPFRIVMDKMSKTLPELVNEQNGNLTKEQLDDLIKLHIKMDKLKIHHNDANPLNIMVDTSGKFKFIDFGMAKMFTNSTNSNANQRALKSLFYGGMQGLLNTTELKKSSFEENLKSYFIKNNVFSEKEIKKL